MPADTIVTCARPPLVRSITSELTGENFKFEEAPPPWRFEESIHPSMVPPNVRALADLAHQLIEATAADIERATNQPTHLHA